MTIKRKTVQDMCIDLDGPQGNAFFLLGMTKTLMEEMEVSKEDQQNVLDSMKKGDYHNLLRVFDTHFGDYITLVTENENLLKALEEDSIH